MAQFRWRRSPMQAWRKDAWIEALALAVRLALLEWSPQIETYAKRHARWTDRTANARQTLQSFVYRDGDRVILIMKQQMTYGKWLELRHGGKYAIVMESLEMHYSQVWQAVRRAVM